MSIRAVSTVLQAKAIRELNEDPKRVMEDIKIVIDWLEKQPHLRARTDPQFILGYLRGCKFSVENVKLKLENLYTMRTLLPDWFLNRDPFAPGIQEILKKGLILPCLKTETEDSPRVIINKHQNTNEHNIHDLCKCTIMMLDVLLMEDDSTVISGIIVINDMTELSPMDIMYVDLISAKKLTTFMLNSYPERIKQSHYINTPSFFDKSFTILKTFTPSKLMQRIKIHKSIDKAEAHKIAPKSVLPKEYGGEAGSLQDLADHWKAKLESYAEWFKEDAMYKSDESKRIGKAKTENDLFGIEGSFRQLTVD